MKRQKQKFKYKQRKRQENRNRDKKRDRKIDRQITDIKGRGRLKNNISKHYVMGAGAGNGFENIQKRLPGAGSWFFLEGAESRSKKVPAPRQRYIYTYIINIVL